MNKVAHYLQEHLLGEVSVSPDLRQYFSHDRSILEQLPDVLAYPRDENDVRKTVRFAWQLAERGRPQTVTVRGFGNGTAGGAIGQNLVVITTTHMDKVEEFDTRRRSTTVQAGANCQELNKILRSHGLWLPACFTDHNYTSIGGALATNAASQKSVKYGNVSSSVKSLRLVLSNGEVMETGPLSKKELNSKLGLQTMEGSIYRAMDTLLEENGEFIRRGREKIKVYYNSSGYNLFDIKKNEQFDLTSLILGSEGTLGIITEASLGLVEAPASTSWVLVDLDDLNDMYEVIPKLLQLKPSAIDFVNRAAIDEVLAINPNQLSGVLSRPQAAIHLFVEFDDAKAKNRQKSLQELQKIVERVNGWSETFMDKASQERLFKLRDSVATILNFSQGKPRAVPVAEDISVPPDRLVEFLHKIDQVYRQLDLPPIVWGQAGSGIVRSQPLLDIGKTGDRQKLFKIQGSLYAAAVELGGSISASSGDGRVRSPYISLLYGQELYELMLKVKKIFDPHGILNPGVKIASPEEVKKMMRNSYSIAHLA